MGGNRNLTFSPKTVVGDLSGSVKGVASAVTDEICCAVFSHYR